MKDCYCFPHFLLYSYPISSYVHTLQGTSPCNQSPCVNSSKDLLQGPVPGTCPVVHADQVDVAKCSFCELPCVS